MDVGRFRRLVLEDLSKRSRRILVLLLLLLSVLLLLLLPPPPPFLVQPLSTIPPAVVMEVFLFRDYFLD